MSYIAYNAAMPTTAALAKVTTGTTIKTLQQLATPASRQMKLIEWGFSLDQAPAATGVGQVELLQTDVAATVTAYSASGITCLDPNGTASLLTLGATASGFTASGEGVPTVSRVFDNQLVAGVTNGSDPINWVRTFMPGYQPIIAVSRFLRVRCTFSAAVNILTWVIWDEI